MPLRTPFIGALIWAQFLLLGLLTLLALLIVYPLARRRALVRRIARSVLALAGMRLRANGLERLALPCVVVANHCSYLDGVVLAAVLPADFSFVIKHEMSRVPLAGLLLRRIGAQFVDRHNRQRGGRDALRLLRMAEDGQSLAFFPEGTFGDPPGLRHFHIGAFAAAARAQVPVTVLSIRGTRQCLPPHSPWPRPGHIDVDVLGQLALPPGTDPSAMAAHLRDQARAMLLGVLGDPDLAAHRA